MSEANKLLLKRWFEEVWNQKSEAAIDKMFSPEGKSHGFPEPDSVLVGPESFKAIHRSFCGAFPDLRVDVGEIVAEGDLVAVRWKVLMTHLGDHLGFAATNKKASLAGSTFAIVKDGKIIEGWNHMDLGALMQKLQAG
jgi:predicted ester cyclase